MAAPVSSVAASSIAGTAPPREMVGPFILGKTLGEGTSGKVKLGIHKDTGEKVAIKILKKAVLTSTPALRRKVEREIMVMRLMDHPHVLRLFDVLQTSRYLFLILEYVEGGELFEYLLKKGRLSPQDAFHFFRQIISGLVYCHKNLICHRDLKPENLLLDLNLNIKIGDFGMASLVKEDSLLETSCGSPHYASPEVVNGEQYNGMQADVWSCGVILYALCSGTLPFDDDNIHRLLNKVRSGTYSMPHYFDPELKDLINRMLTLNPQQRITIAEIKKHPWWRTQRNIQKEVIRQRQQADPRFQGTPASPSSSADSLAGNNGPANVDKDGEDIFEMEAHVSPRRATPQTTQQQHHQQKQQQQQHMPSVAATTSAPEGALSHEKLAGPSENAATQQSAEASKPPEEPSAKVDSTTSTAVVQPTTAACGEASAAQSGTSDQPSSENRSSDANDNDGEDDEDDTKDESESEVQKNKPMDEDVLNTIQQLGWNDTENLRHALKEDTTNNLEKVLYKLLLRRKVTTGKLVAPASFNLSLSVSPANPIVDTVDVDRKSIDQTAAIPETPPQAEPKGFWFSKLKKASIFRRKPSTPAVATSSGSNPPSPPRSPNTVDSIAFGLHLDKSLKEAQAEIIRIFGVLQINYSVISENMFKASTTNDAVKFTVIFRPIPSSRGHTVSFSRSFGEDSAVRGIFEMIQREIRT